MRLDGLEREGVGALGESQGDAGDGGGGAMLGGEDDAVVAVAAEIEVGIAPGMELGGAAQGLAGADGAATLAGVVDDGDGNRVAALKIAQEGEHRRHFAAGVLIDAVQADERIEDEQPRLQGGDGLVETAAVGVEIEAQAGRGDHLDIERRRGCGRRRRRCRRGGGGRCAARPRRDRAGRDRGAAPGSGAGRECRRRPRRRGPTPGRICSTWVRRR